MIADAPYVLKGRLKNNRLWTAIIETWPEVRTQVEAADKLKIQGTLFGCLLNMKLWPYNSNPGRGHRVGWMPVAVKIADALGLSCDYLFEARLYGQAPPPVEIPLGPRLLPEAARQLALPPHPERRDAILAALRTLTPREEKVIKMRFALEPFQREYSQEEIGKHFGVGKAAVSQIEINAMRKLRYPTRSRALRAAVRITDDEGYPGDDPDLPPSAV